MNEPRRLSKSGGVSQRLLDSASLDKPSIAARVRANALAATASSFARTHSGGGGGAGNSGVVPKLNPAKTLATWVIVGAAASVSLALIGTKLLGSPSQSGAAAPAAPAMSVLAEAPAPSPAPARPPEISPEPPAPANGALPLAPVPSHSLKPSAAASVEPWVPSPIAAAPAAAPGAPPPSSASFNDEARAIEAARVAVSRGDDSGALAQLNDYDSSHPNGELKPESMALRIQVLSNTGKTSEARTLANEFQGKYPQHPLVQQVKRNVPK